MGSLRRVGSLWKPRPGGNPNVKGTGSLTTNGLRQRFMVVPNSKKAEGDSQPDYVLLSGDNPEVDQYSQGQQQPAKSAAPATQQKPAATAAPDDDLPFVVFLVPFAGLLLAGARLIV